MYESVGCEMGYEVVYSTCFGRLYGEFVHYMIQNQRSANALRRRNGLVPACHVHGLQ